MVTNDPPGAAHLPPVSCRERRYFYLRGCTVATRSSILLNSSRSLARAYVVCCTRGGVVRELFHSLNPSGAAANTVTLPGDSSVPATRDSFNTGREKRVLPFTRLFGLTSHLSLSLHGDRRFFQPTLLSCAPSCAHESHRHSLKRPGTMGSRVDKVNRRLPPVPKKMVM